MNVKKLLSIFAATLIFGSAMALDHGSINVKNSQMYGVIGDDTGVNMSDPITGLTLDFKLVTIGTKTWAWTNLNGSGISGDDWASQLRWYDPAKNAVSLTGRVSGTAQTYGNRTDLPASNSTTVRIFQYPTTPGNWTYRETANITYDYTLKNSKDNMDNTAPVLANPAIVSQTATQLKLSLSATDDSNDFFYYVTNTQNSYAEVFFLSEISIPLIAGTDYDFSIQAIDFSGNESAAKTVSITGSEQPSECNNLLDGKTLSLGSVFYNPNWGGTSTDYTASVVDNNFNLRLGKATGGEWQAQFRIMFNTPVVMVPGNQYSLSMDVTTSKNTNIYAKFYAGTDGTELQLLQKAFVADQTVTWEANDLTCPQALTQITQILFDFRYSPDNIDYTISNISICDLSNPENPTGMQENNSDEMQTYISDGRLTIKNGHPGSIIQIFDIQGRKLYEETLNSQLQTVNYQLNSGVCLAKIGNKTIKTVR